DVPGQPLGLFIAALSELILIVRSPFYLAVAPRLIVDFANLVNFSSVCFSSSKVVWRRLAPSSSFSNSAWVLAVSVAGHFIVLNALSRRNQAGIFHLGF